MKKIYSLFTGLSLFICFTMASCSSGSRRSESPASSSSHGSTSSSSSSHENVSSSPSSSGNVNQSSSTEELRFTVVWANFDGTVLETDIVGFGEIPIYNGSVPVKPGDAQYTYAFTGWSPEITAVTGDKTYTAQFSGSVNSYTITWDVDGAMTTESYEYGATPSYKNGTPTKVGDAQYTYAFTGWSPEITAVTGDKTYTATFEESIRKYTITFDAGEGYFDDDKSLHEKYIQVEYGKIPVFSDVPSMFSREFKTVSFLSWNSEFTAAFEDKTYTALYEYGEKRTDVLCIEYDFNRNGSTVGLKFGNSKWGYKQNSVTIDWGDGNSEKYTIDYKGSTITHTYNQFCGGTYYIFVSQFKRYDASEPFYLSDSFGNGNKYIKRIDVLNSTSEYSASSYSYGRNTIDSGYYSLYFSSLSGLEEVYVDNFKQYTQYLEGSENACKYHNSIIQIFDNPNLANIEFKSFTSTTYSEETGNEGKPIVGKASLADCKFSNNSKLKAISFGTSTINIVGSETFYGCSSLIKISGLSNLEKIDSHAFYGCTKLQSVPNAKVIEYLAFAYCASLHSFSSNSSITSISVQCFLGCTSLESVSIPTSVTSINGEAFYDCANLKTIYYSGTTAQFLKISTASDAFENSGLKEVRCTDGTLNY